MHIVYAYLFTCNTAPAHTHTHNTRTCLFSPLVAGQCCHRGDDENSQLAGSLVESGDCSQPAE